MKARRLSDQEKLEKIQKIDADVANGSTLKDAVAIAGVSDQTYYQWKKALSAFSSPEKVTKLGSDAELAEFEQIEEENRRLRKLLAKKLMAENAELRRRLRRK